MSELQKTFNDKLKKHLHATFFIVYYKHLTSPLATFSSKIDESDDGIIITCLRSLTVSGGRSDSFFSSQLLF